MGLDKTDPENYWINQEGEYVKRGEPQFFINELGQVRPISKEKYLIKLRYQAAKTTVEEVKPPKKGDIYMGKEDYDNK